MPNTPPPIKFSTGNRYRRALPASSILLGVLFAVSLRYDILLFQAVNGLHSPLTDRLWLGVTTLGDGLLIGVMLGAFLTVNPRITFFGLVMVILSSAVVHIFKGTLDTPRPAAVLDSVHVIGSLLRSGSFPSGHAAAATAAGLAIARYAPSVGLAVTAMTVAALIAVSRVFVGAHFPSDVVAGVLTSVMVYSALNYTVWSRLEARIPAKPDFTNKRFRAAYHFTGVAAVFTMLGYAPLFSDYPVWCGAVALAVLIVLLTAPRRKS